MKVLPADSTGCLLGYINNADDPDYATIPDTEETLIYVHIGKCGGASLWEAIANNPGLKTTFRSIFRLHICKPPVLQNARYLFVVRNPIERALSAFNWRHFLVQENRRIVVENRKIRAQRERFAGEHRVLEHYGSLSALAEALYSGDGSLDAIAAADFNAIHHLKENIAFYLSDLLPAIEHQQVFAVMAAETLDEDIARDLGNTTVERFHSNQNKTTSDHLDLSPQARTNLRRFLDDDYTSIRRLLELSSKNGLRAEVPFDL